MHKGFVRAAMAVLMVVAAAGGIGNAAAPAADFSGTWLGTTMVPDIGENKITLELKAEGQSYTGKATDSAGVVVPAPITNVTVDGATITFDLSANNGSATFPVHLTLKLDGDTLAGNWTTDNGDAAPISLTRKK